MCNYSIYSNLLSGSWKTGRSFTVYWKKPHNNVSRVRVGRVHVKVEVSEFTDDS